MIDPVVCFRLYIALKTHYTSKRYNAVKHNCRVKNASASDFEARNDKALITGFAKLADTPAEMTSILIACFSRGLSYPFDDIEQAMDLYKKWKKNRDSITQLFKQALSDIENAVDSGRKKESLFTPIYPNLPYVFTMFMNGTIPIEVMTILDELEPGFTDALVSEHPMWKNVVLRIKKNRDFVKYDKNTIEDLYRNFKKDLELTS